MRRHDRDLGVGAAGLASQLAKAEESLAHLSRMQESILESAGEGVYGTDTDGRITFVNPAAAAMLGWQPEELIGRSAHATLHHSRADGTAYPAEECHIHKSFAMNRGYRSEDEIFWKKDGSPLATSLAATPLSDADEVVGGVVVFSDISERKEIHNRLLKSESELREAQEVARLGSWSWDVCSDTITWSDQLYRIFGADADHFDPTYAAYLQRLHPADRPLVQSIMSAAIEKREPFQFDHRIIRADGSIGWIQSRGRVVEKPDRGLCLFGTALDISERVHAEERLRNSEERYRSIFDNAVEGIYQSSLDGRILSINPAGARILGYASPVEAIAGITNVRHIYVDPARREHLIDTLSQDGAVTGYETQVRRSDGDIIWVQLNVRVVGEPGEPGAFMEGMLLDVSARKRAEDYLRQSEARTKAIFVAAPDPIVTLDEEASITGFNPAAEVVFGLDREEAAVRIDDLIRIEGDPQGRPSLSDRLRMRDGSVIGTRFEATGMRAGGDEFPIEVSITCGDVGESPFFAAHVRDVTDQKRAQQAREQLELQVQHGQKMEALGHLAGGIAHDFNNLLAVIENYATFVREELQGRGPVSEDVDQILNAVRRGSALTRQLVMFARRDEVKPTTVDLNSVVMDMERLLRRTIPGNVRVATELTAPLWPICVDVGQLEQVIMNLVLNGTDAMPGGGRLTLRTTNTEIDEARSRWHVGLGPGNFVRLSVSDTGCGIPAGVRDRIFEPFFTLKEKDKGTGLGLATVYGIVKRWSGYISCDSEEGRGSTFDVYLPAVGSIEDAGTAGGASFGEDTGLVVVTYDRRKNHVPYPPSLDRRRRSTAADG